MSLPVPAPASLLTSFSGTTSLSSSGDVIGTIFVTGSADDDIIIPIGGEQEIIKLMPYLHAGGNFAFLHESAEISCSADCID